MDLQYNKTDSVVLPITNTRISASEYNQIAGSLMQIISSAGLPPDSQDNAQLLNALKAIGSGWAMPSSSYDNLTLGASGATYTMPANGWLWLDKTNGTTDRYILFRCSSLSIPGEYTCCVPGANTHLTLLMPVKKGDVITVNYNATGATNYFRFIYAEGSKSEAN